MFLVFCLFGGGLSLVLDQPIWPVCPGFEDVEQHFLIDSIKNISGSVHEASRIL
jgi:hypothetical protein